MSSDSSIIISASGVRGVVGEGLTPELIAKLACAFGARTGGEILVGYDTRTSNEMFKYAVFSGLLSAGCKVIDGGICPTPSLQFTVRKTRARGGIVITGSHNPAQWNALKFVRSDGLFLFPEQGAKVVELYKRNDLNRAKWNKLGTISKDTSVISRHVKKVIQLVDGGKIRRRGFKVVVDACGGAGALTTPHLLEKLGCQVIRLNCVPHGNFPHLPEPTPAHLKELCRVVTETGADVGLAHDADADRLALVSEKGEALSEEYTLMLGCKFVLRNQRGVVVTNVCTSSGVDDIANEFNCTVKRVPVGDINVSRCMRKCGAVIGGEGNGGVIFPPMNYARDGIMSSALILNYLATENIPLSGIVESLPCYCMVKKKVSSKGIDVHRLSEKLKKGFNQNRLDLTDGVKVFFPEGWVHVRASGTEPVLRVISEAKNEEKAQEFSRWALSTISEFKDKV